MLYGGACYRLIARYWCMEAQAWMPQFTDGGEVSVRAGDGYLVV